MNRALSSLDIFVIVTELQDLIGSFVDNIYQISKNDIIIKINNKMINQKEIIFIRNSEFLCTTKKKFIAPKKPTTFAMTARKYLKNSKISSITQYKFDRIIQINFQKKEGEYALFIELFSNGNIILSDPYRKIIIPLIVQRWAHRTIKPKEKYIPPPNQINPFELNFDKFKEILKSSKKDIVRTLAAQLNLGGLYAEEICSRSGIDKNKEISILSKIEIEKTFNELKTFLKIFEDKNFKPVHVKKEEELIDILPFKFKSYIDGEFIEIVSFNKGLEDFISIPKTIDKEKKALKDKILKLQRQFEKQNQIIEDYKEEISRKKSEGDIIYLNYHLCNELLKDILQVLELKDKKEKIEEINKRNIVKNFNPSNNELVVILNDEMGTKTEVQLDFRKTITKNANKSYNRSKKLQEKIKGAEKALEDTLKKIEELEKEIKFKKEVEEYTIEKKYWFEKYRWFISTDGNIVIAGRDAKSNEQIVKKYLKTGDRYVHADIHGAPSCIVKSINYKDEKVPISDKTLKEACIFAGSYSKAWKQFSETQVYWVLPEQVSKTPQSGEFLAKGSFVIRGKRNYLKCVIEAAVGEVDIEGLKKMMGAPLDSMKARSKKYIVLKPGIMKKNTISKKLSKIFHTSTQEIDGVLPPGEVTVTETVGVEIK
jgi:predicted ribosome quality control (RQC) complex YloA/Tae2 family protein